jgi:hypothetical protein
MPNPQVQSEALPNRALTAAVLRILRPLVRVLLRHGVAYGAFADLAKSVFVEVADKDCAIAGRKQTISRIAVLTGLTRKEVVRLQALESPEDGVAEKRYNRAARVVAGWVRDARFRNPLGMPLDLNLDGPGGFSELVRSYSGDMPVRAVLDELVRVGAVSINPDQTLHLLERSYVPQAGVEDKLHILGSDVALLIETIDHNLCHAGEDLRFQRKVAYDNLPDEAVEEFRRLSRQQAQQLIETMDQWLARHDRDFNPAVTGHGRKHAGIGIYYFEEDVPGRDER